LEGSPEVIQSQATGGFSSSRLDSTAPTILKPEASLATEQEQAPTELYRSEKKALEDSPGGFIQNKSGLVGFNSTPVQKSPAIAAEGRNIELQESVGVRGAITGGFSVQINQQ
jgi:hypothetical protein